MIWDQLSLQIAFLLAYMLRNGLSNPYSHLIYCNVAFILVVIDAGVLLLFESLKNVLKRGYYQEFAMTAKHVILVILVTTFYLFYIKRSEDYSRLALFYMTALYLFVSYLTMLLATVYFSSLAFSVLEHKVNPLVHSYGDALWWAFMDVTTVGSNIIAVTVTGRVLSVLLAALGMMMFPIFTVYITNLIQQSNKRKKQYYAEEEEEKEKAVGQETPAQSVQEAKT